MKLINYDLETAIDFDVNDVWTLVCENPKMFATVTENMCHQAKGIQGKWKLLVGDKELDIAKYVVYLADFHSISLNDKKATSLLQDNIKQLAWNENHYLATNELISSIEKYFDELTQDVDYPVSIKEVDLSTLLKSVSVAFLEEYSDFFEKLLDYTTLLSRLTITKLIVCVGLRNYLTSEQLSKFFCHCRENGLHILCIEGYCKQKLPEETILCSDEDLCEFFVENVEK